MPRLQHQYQREVLFAGAFLLPHVAAKVEHLSERHPHESAFSCWLFGLCSTRAGFKFRCIAEQPLAQYLHPGFKVNGPAAKEHMSEQKAIQCGK